MMAYGKGHFSGLITFLRSFALLLLFLILMPQYLGLKGIWIAVPAAELLTAGIALWALGCLPKGWRNPAETAHKEIKKK